MDLFGCCFSYSHVYLGLAIFSREQCTPSLLMLGLEQALELHKVSFASITSNILHLRATNLSLLLDFSLL